MRIPELDRINALARLAKLRALSPVELAEREVLRRRYMQAVTGQVGNVLGVMTVIDLEGNDVTPQKLREAQQSGLMPQVGF
ncbi:hypothetical protein DTO96_100108 [Ephemeroptericola cinctiostellae]|uniref:Uncharacterized protein n=1 Tax=Ephemeroptericola cinctiostellae TaxID=2268024 RepID=A0A345D7R7_9BURK|nr:DUF896 domain-containing protein [Ephemeroptericola cinctiostellae]AXF84405.1 hypothetical protein DTO96_100108 [Ephemeroptericola cinctiostellae]